MSNTNTAPFFLFLSCLLFLSCGEKKAEKENKEQDQILVYDFDNKAEKDQFDKLILDKTHPNLLNPQISETDLDQIRVSWTELHQDIGKYLDENNFSWEIDDRELNILHKFYFTPNGKIKFYFFRVANSRVSDAKRKEFAGLMADFATSYQLSLERQAQYAQCGKTRYIIN